MVFWNIDYTIGNHNIHPRQKLFAWNREPGYFAETHYSSYRY